MLAQTSIGARFALRMGLAAAVTGALVLGSLTSAGAATPTPAPMPTPTHTAPDSPASSEPGTGQILGNVYTSVSTNPRVGQPVAGASVTAYTLDSAGTATARASVSSGRTGDYLFTNLPAGTYYLKFDRLPASAGRVSQWLFQTALAPHGRSTTITDQASVLEYAEDLRIPIVFSGTVTCELCSTPPDPATTSIELWAEDYGTLTRVQTVRPTAAGRYTFPSVFPAANQFEVRVVSSGQDSFAPQSAREVPQPVVGPAYTLDLIEARRVHSVPGVPNSFVAELHAIYADFLHRGATDADVSNWYRSSEGFDGRAAYLIGTSDEARLIRIDAAYRRILNRSADAGGRLNWLNAVKAGSLSINDLDISLYGSQEYFQAHGATNATYVTALYSALLGRASTSSDVAFWSAQIAGQGRSWVAGRFWNTPEAILVRVQADYTFFNGFPARGAALDAALDEVARYGEEQYRTALVSRSYYDARVALRYRVG